MEAVLFDASGVLYRRQRYYGRLRAFLWGERLPAPEPEELQRIRARVHRGIPGAERREKYDAFLAALGVTDPTRQAEGRRVLVEEASQITLFPGVAETLRALKARGLRLGVITNTATPSAEKQRWLKAKGVDVAFDSFVASCEAGVAKPDPRIYELALAECGVTPDAAVFVGHDAVELNGARAVGMRTVAFAAPDDVVADARIARFADLPGLTLLRAPAALESGAVSHRTQLGL